MQCRLDDFDHLVSKSEENERKKFNLSKKLFTEMHFTDVLIGFDIENKAEQHFGPASPEIYM